MNISKNVVFAFLAFSSLAFGQNEDPAVEAVGCRYFSVTPSISTNFNEDKFVMAVFHQADETILGFIQEEGSLGPVPVEKTAQEWGTVHVSGASVIPNQEFLVSGTFLNGVAVTFDIGSALTWHWGDVTGDNVVNLNDILKVLQDFACSNCSGILSSDLVGGSGVANSSPDGIVNLSDILAVLLAFGGQQFPG